MTLLDREAAEPKPEPGPSRPTRSAATAPVARPTVDDRRGRRAAEVAAAVIAVLPLVTDPGGWYVFLAARWAFLVAAVGVALVVLVASGRVRVPDTWRWWSAMAAVAAVSSAVSSAPGVSWWGAPDRFGGGVTWLVYGGAALIGASVVRRTADLRVVVRGVSAAAVMVTVFVGAQRFGWSFPAGGSNVRPGGSLGNADFLGAFAAFSLLVAAGAAIDRGEDERWRLAHLVAVLCSATCLVVSGTRAGWFGVAVGLLVLGVLLGRRSGLGGRQAAGLVAVVLVGLVGLGMWAGVAHRLGTLTSGTAAGRLSTWERTMSAVGERPLFGWGSEGFAEGFGRAVDDRWEREYGRRLVPDRAHNGLLDVAAATGLVGLVAYVGLVGASGRSVRRALVVGDDGSGAVSTTIVGSVAAMVAYLVQQQFLFQLFDVDAVVWFVAGAVGALGARAAVPSAGDACSVPRRAVAGLVAVAALVVTIVAVGDVGADRHARRSVDARTVGAAIDAAGEALEHRQQTMFGLLLADAALADGGPEVLVEVRDRLGVVRGATFDDGRLTLARARLARADGRVALVEQSAAEVVALLRSDRARGDGWLEFGELQLTLGDGGAAQRSFERAVSLAPGRTDAWVLLGVTAARNGDERVAAEAFGRVDPSDLDPTEMMLARQVRAAVRGGDDRPSSR